MSDSAGFQFVDTNILVYAHDVSAGDKHERAKKLIVELWHSGKGCISIQVLQELYVTIGQKISRPISPEIASQIIASLAEWRLHIPQIRDLLDAIEIHQRFKISCWDALIICSAMKLGCELIWTEDLSSGQDFEGVKALNPFIGD